jgi:hypothetical protein
MKKCRLFPKGLHLPYTPLGDQLEKAKKSGFGRGTFVETQMFLSSAYKTLGRRGSCQHVSSASHVILMMLLGKRQFRTDKTRKGQRKVQFRTDGNRLTLTYKELEAHGISNQLAAKGFDELLAKGFIEIIDAGGAFEKHKAVYGLTDDYLFWKPGKDPIRTRQRDVKRGWQNRQKNKNRYAQSQTPTLCTVIGTHIGGHYAQS